MTTFNSTTKGVPAIEGDGVDIGITGKAQDGWAISGESKKQVGVRGFCENGWGVSGESKNQVGVRGYCEPGWGVAGESKTGIGVRGVCDSYFGVAGESNSSSGVVGLSKQWMGVYGKSEGKIGAGVMGEGNSGSGVIGKSTKWIGVYGETAGIENGPAGVWGEHKGAGVGVKAVSNNGAGLAAYSTSNEAIHAETHSPTVASIAAFNLNSEGTGAAIYGKKEGNKGHAGFFEGDVYVSRKLTVKVDIVLENADCAEDFNIGLKSLVEPGTVMVLGEEGALFPSLQAYDKRVAGVVSGAGDYKPGIVLDKQASESNRQPIALLGKVFCKVDAQYGAIEVGDLLTTSPTPGHAMKADEPLKAFGAVIGKALRPLKEGQGLIPVLIALQ